MRNDWISPYFILTYYHSKCAGQAQEAISAILQNASDTASQGPWSVVHDGNLSPDGNSRSYVSWAPYYWPGCCEDLNENGLAAQKRQAEVVFGKSHPSHSLTNKSPALEGILPNTNTGVQLPVINPLLDNELMPLQAETAKIAQGR